MMLGSFSFLGRVHDRGEWFMGYGLRDMGNYLLSGALAFPGFAKSSAFWVRKPGSGAPEAPQ